MPPKKPPKMAQRTIKETLLNKAAKKQEDNQQEASCEAIYLPSIFREQSNIGNGAPLDYKCTTYSQTYFREHSNLDDIIKAFRLVKEHRQDYPFASFIPLIMREVISGTTSRKHEPFSLFRFNTTRHEQIGRVLLANPSIKSSQDLAVFLRFQNQHQLKFCSVNLFDQNEVDKDAKAFLVKKQHEQNTTELPRMSKPRLKAFILKKYYRRENLVENFYLKDCTLKEFENISNFKRIVEKHMETNNEPSQFYNRHANTMLQGMQNDTSDYLALTELLINPKYDIICNYISEEIQDILSRKMNTFFESTNASSQMSRFHPEMTKEQFYELYKNSKGEQKKLYPFHQLYYLGGLDELAEALIPLNTSVQTMEMQHQSRIRFERNENRSENSSDVSNGASVETVLQTTAIHANQSKSLNVEVSLAALKKVQLPEEYLNQIQLSPSQDVYELARVFILNKAFVASVKKELSEMYKLNFENLWKQNKGAILSNYINKNYDHGAIEKLAKMTSTLSPEDKRIVHDIAKGRNNIENEEAPSDALASASKVSELSNKSVDKCLPQTIVEKRNQMENEEISSKIVLGSIPNAPEASNFVEITSCEDDDQISVLMADGDDFPLPETVTIKKEKISDESIHYTDVECLGEVLESTICISDSEEADTSLVRELLHESENPFLKEINADGQYSQLGDIIQSRSDDTLQQLKDFEPQSVQQILNDQRKKGEGVLKDNNAASSSTKVSNRVGPLCSKSSAIPSTKRKSKDTVLNVNKKIKIRDIQYVDEEDSPNSGKNDATTLTRGHNDDLNVFLSSQLLENLNEATETAVYEASAFTYAKSSGDMIDSTENICFVAELHQVSFIKNVKFEVNVSFPQYSIFNIIIRDDHVKQLLNLTDFEYISVMDLLETIEKYQFSSGHTRYLKCGRDESHFIRQQLDHFFATQIKFKMFTLSNLPYQK